MKRIIFVLLALVFVCTSAFAGVEWKMKMTIQGQNKAVNNTIISQVYAQADAYKQVFESVDKEGMMYQKGSYMLLKGKSNTLYMVNPEKKTYSELPLDAIAQMAGSMGKLVKMKISNPQVKMEKLGVETVMGYPCTHYKLVMDYDTEVKVVLIKSKSHEHVEKEVWSSPKINPLEVVEGFRYRAFKSGFEDLDTMIDIQLKAEGQLGFPLKMEQVTSTIDKKGNSKETMRITQEVLAVGTKTFPAGFFEIPADYQPQKGGLFN